MQETKREKDPRKGSNRIEPSSLFVCGTSDHFTDFTILLEGGSVLGPKGKTYAYFSGSSTSDVLISLGVLVGVFLVLIILFSFFTKTTLGRKIFFGKETLCVKMLTLSRSKSSKDSTKDQETEYNM